MSKLIDLTNQDFGYWHVIERAPNDSRGQSRWRCVCTACGTERIVQGGHLRSGNSTGCGCTRQFAFKNEEGKIYGFLQVKRKATEDEKPRKRQGVYWVCKCLRCGKDDVIVFGDYLRNGDTTSCGCLVSKNEEKIAKMLQERNILFKKQVTFEDLTSTGRSCDKLLFDFGIFDDKQQLLYLIEYDGHQHFAPKESWNGSNFETIRRNDLLKNQYCFEHNIPLIRIPYNEQYDIKDLLLATTNFLLTSENETRYYNIRR